MKLICFLVVCLTSFQAVAGGEVGAVHRELSAADTESRWIRSDERGLWDVSGLSKIFSKKMNADLLFTNSVVQGFGSDQVDRTRETGIEFRVENKIDPRNFWITSVTASVTRQERALFGIEKSYNPFRQRTYSISKTWRHMLEEGLAMELFSGLAQCNRVMAGDRRYVPFGGIRFSKHFGWGDLTASLSQGVHGGGSLSGVYGSQVKREFRLGGAAAITENFSVRWDCGIAAVTGLFTEADMLRKVPVVSAGVSVDYQPASAVKISAGYAHRTLVGSYEAAHGATGPIATASLTYAIF